MATFVSACLTDIGRKRSKNQDYLATSDQMGLFIVADGMGGHKGGEIASRLACETIVETFKVSEGVNARERLNQSISTACGNIFVQSQKDQRLKGMGTTVTAMYFEDDILYIGHVGDSRAYVLEDKFIWQLTRDHSLVQERIMLGQLTREQAKLDKMRNVILRSVGVEPTVQVDIFSYRPQPGQLFLACSDGLSGRLDDNTMAHLVKLPELPEDPSTLHQTLQQKTKILIDAANQSGGDDNISAILVKPIY